MSETNLENNCNSSGPGPCFGNKGKEPRYFLSYKFTGVPIEQLFREIDPICDLIEGRGYEFFCNLYDNANYQKYGCTPTQIMNHALSELDGSTHCLVYISEIFGGGSAIEVGYAIAKGIPIIALINSNLTDKLTSKTGHTSLKALSETIIYFDGPTDLNDKLLQLLSKNVGQVFPSPPPSPRSSCSPCSRSSPSPNSNE